MNSTPKETAAAGSSMEDLLSSIRQIISAEVEEGQEAGLAHKKDQSAEILPFEGAVEASHSSPSKHAEISFGPAVPPLGLSAEALPHGKKDTHLDNDVLELTEVFEVGNSSLTSMAYDSSQNKESMTGGDAFMGKAKNLGDIGSSAATSKGAGALRQNENEKAEASSETPQNSTAVLNPQVSKGGASMLQKSDKAQMEAKSVDFQDPQMMSSSSLSEDPSELVLSDALQLDPESNADGGAVSLSQEQPSALNEEKMSVASEGEANAVASATSDKSGSASSFLSEETINESVEAFSALSEIQKQLKHGLTPENMGKMTVEQLVCELLKPLLKDWLNANLPSLVKWLVAEEIEKMMKKTKASKAS